MSVGQAIGVLQIFSGWMLSHHGAQPTLHEWVRLYKISEDELPKLVVSGVNSRDLDLVQCNILHILWVPSVSLVLGRNTLLLEWWIQMRGTCLHPQLSQVGCLVLGWYRVARGNFHTQFTLFWGEMDQHFFELAHWWWHVVNPFLACTTKLGRNWITTTQEAL